MAEVWGWHGRIEVDGRGKKAKGLGFHAVMESALPPCIGTMPQIREPQAVRTGKKPPTPSSGEKGDRAHAKLDKLELHSHTVSEYSHVLEFSDTSWRFLYNPFSKKTGQVALKQSILFAYYLHVAN